jgi:uncharacterized protein with HEPN domain
MAGTDNRDALAQRYGERTVDRLDDLLAFCAEARQLVDDGKEQLLNNWRQQRAAEAVLNRIGGSTSHLPEAFRAAHPGQAWKKIIGQRIWVTHRYGSLDYNLVWTSLTEAAELHRYVLRVLGDD